MRISPEAVALIRSAAEKQQQDVTAFVSGAAMERALDSDAAPSSQLVDLIRSVRRDGAALSDA